MTKIAFSIGKVVKMTKIWGPRHGFWEEALSRSSSQKAARTWPSHNLIRTLKGVQNGQNQVKFGVPQNVPQGPSGQREQIGTFWPGPKIWAQEGSKWTQNRVKMAFSLTPDRQNDQNWLFNRKNDQIGQNWHFHKVLARCLQRALSGQSKLPGREVLGPKWSKMRSFRGFTGGPKVVKMTKIWGPRHRFERVQTGPPAQRQLVRGLAATSLQDPQRGPKWSKSGQIWGPSKVPPRSIRTKGTNRHIWPGPKIWAQEGSKWGQNRVKMAFSLTPDRQNDKIDFSIGKSGQNDQNLRSQAWVCEALSRSSGPKAACTGPSRNLIQDPQKGPKWSKIRSK